MISRFRRRDCVILNRVPSVGDIRFRTTLTYLLDVRLAPSSPVPLRLLTCLYERESIFRRRVLRSNLIPRMIIWGFDIHCAAPLCLLIVALFAISMPCGMPSEAFALLMVTNLLRYHANCSLGPRAWLCRGQHPNETYRGVVHLDHSIGLL